MPFAWPKLPTTVINPKKSSCGPIPTAVALPRERRRVAVLGGDEAWGAVLVQGLRNVEYSSAFDVLVLPASAAHDCAAPESTFSTQLAGVHTLLCASQRDYDSGGAQGAAVQTQWEALLSACQRAGVKRVVPSPFDFDVPAVRKLAPDFPFIQRRLDEQRALQDSELKYTVISCGVLAERLLPSAAVKDAPRQPIVALCPLDTRVAFTTLEDLARLLPEVLISRSAVNAHVQLASASFSYRDLASALREAGEAQFRCEWRQAAGEDAGTRALMAVLASGRGAHWTKGDSWNATRVPHVRTSTLREYALRTFSTRHSDAAVRAPQLNQHPSEHGCARPFSRTGAFIV